MRIILHFTFLFIFITFLLGSWSSASAKKININAENLSRRYNDGSISSDSSVKRRLNRIQVRAVTQKNSNTITATATTPAITPKGQVSNQSNPIKNNASGGKLMNDKAPGQGQDVNATQPVITDMSPAVIGTVCAVCAVCLLVAGVFTVVNRRKRQELTDSIVATSAVAWEQDVVEELKEEETLQPIGSYTVIDTYVPTLPDELDIQLGDKVTILMIYDDGWVQGINETRGGNKGVFPQHCVNMNISFNNKRSSSMGGYTIVDLN
ncbi:7644_t:CDS:2 [Cetraspora pellucida]|uniref:7644_t:CDS:1 n=1 Tax=Cetraspora pellucida TaxID=1433469 RepID=A0A9N9D538_9GLOM|nr:7644_t:CDS:2 [Cetraspora pellucida]